MTVSETLARLADSIRGLSLTTDKMTVVQMADLVQSVTPNINETANLLQDPFNLKTGWINAGGNLIEVAGRGFSYVRITPGRLTGNAYVYQPSIKSISKGDLYICSFYAKADNVGDKIHTETYSAAGFKNFPLTKSWQRLYVKARSRVDATSLYFGAVSGNKGNVYLALPTLVKLAR